VTNASYENGQLELSIRDQDGNAIHAGVVDAVIGRPTTDRNDERVEFVIQRGVYTASIPLDSGMWMLKINAVSHQGDPFTQRFDIWVN
jgi:nitrogen fixation protein FixH